MVRFNMGSPNNFEKSPVKTKNKRDARRHEIINASIDIFYEYGYHKASMRDIARKVGVTQASLYYHFRNKEEICYTIVNRASNDLLLTLKSILKQEKDPIEKLKDIIIGQILMIKTRRKEVKILIEDKKFLSAELNKLIKDQEKMTFDIFKSNMEVLKRQGKVRDFDLTTATFGIFGMMNWLYHWYRPEKNLSLEQLAEQIVSNLFHGLLRDEKWEEGGKF
ncbi:MAG: TetR family transcriptional regulator [Desulfobacteraceae bacterium]|nr:TetR family transcriptional regulator [Desulfobacteraceae bacterium]